MRNELDDDIAATQTDAAYDLQAKRLLGHKEILAQILIKTVDAFSHMSPEEVATCIEGEVYIATVPVDPGLTNQETESSDSGGRIVGLNTENAELREGLIRFDIIFYARVKDEPVQIIINVEAQKDEPRTYNILNRAIFYVCRLVSSQKDRDFVKMNYNDIKQVYSIWVCLGMDECVLDHFHLKKDTLLNEYNWKGNLDLLNIVMVGLPQKLPERGEKYELHRLLYALLNSNLPVTDRLQIVHEECPTQMGDELREELIEMCNLSQGIREEGRKEGIIETNTSISIHMYKKGYSLEEIAELTELGVDEVRDLILRTSSLEKTP